MTIHKIKIHADEFKKRNCLTCKYGEYSTGVPCYEGNRGKWDKCDEHYSEYTKQEITEGEKIIMENNLEKISAKLKDNEQLALDSMLNGESVVETAHSLAVSVQEAQTLRKAVYCAAEEFIEFGSNTKEKQQKLIDFCKQDETKETKIATEKDKIIDVRPATVKESVYAYYALFEHMVDEHNLTLLESELQQIYNIVNKDLENDIKTRINENNKLRAELVATQEKLKPFKDSYFGELTFEEIAELAKKSIRITADNSELEDKIEKLSEELDIAKEALECTKHNIEVGKETIEQQVKNTEEMLAEQSAEYVRSFKNQLLHALDIASSADEVDLDSLVEQVRELRKQKDLSLFKDFETQNSTTSNFLVFNPKNGAPNKVYKNINSALEDAKSVAKKEQEPVFVLRIDSLVVPQCTFDVHDVSQGGIPERYLSDGIPF